MPASPFETPPALPSALSPTWDTVREGLTWSAAGLMIMFLGMMALFVATVFAVAEIFDPKGLFLMFVLTGSALVALVGSIMLLIGQCLCSLVPQESGTRALVLGAVLCSALSLMSNLGDSFAMNFLSSGREEREQVPRWREVSPNLERPGLFRTNDTNRRPSMAGVHELVVVRLVGSSANVVGSIFFTCFLCGVARHVGNVSLAWEVSVYLVYNLSVIVALFGGITMVGLLGQSVKDQEFHMVLGWMVLGVVLMLVVVAFVWLVSLLLRTRNAIREFQRKCLLEPPTALPVE